MAAVGVIVFVLALLASIAIHELGHLLTAKHYGMKASRYFIGMGPTLWSRWRGETESGVKAFPIGGFVKIVGMTQLEELEDPRDEPRAFWRQPARKRAVVLAAGSFMHFVIAFATLYVALVGFGEPATETRRVAEVSQCLDPDPKTDCAGRDPAPARVAGVRVGDEVIEFDGRPIAKWADLTTQVKKHPAGKARLVVLRDGARVPIALNVVRLEQVVDDEGTVEVVGRIGLVPGDTDHYNPVSGLIRTGSLMRELTVGSAKAMVEIPAKVPEVFKSAKKEPGSAPRRVDDGRIIGFLDAGRLSAQAFEARSFLAVVSMIAALNVFVGLFNLLPLLPLDGGHLGILAFEETRSRIARLLGRKDPGRVDLRKLMPAMVAFIVVMGSLTLVLLYAGIVNPVANPFTD